MLADFEFFLRPKPLQHCCVTDNVFLRPLSSTLWNETRRDETVAFNNHEIIITHIFFFGLHYLHWFANAFVGLFNACIETEMEWTANRGTGRITLFTAFLVRSIGCCCRWWVPVVDFFFAFGTNVRSVCRTNRRRQNENKIKWKQWIQFGVNLTE